MLKTTIRIVYYTIMVFIIAISTTSCKFTGKRYYETYTGKYVTIWNDYIIFEKYKSNKPPKDNYIKVIGLYKGSLAMVFKTNDSVYIWRDDDENSMEIGLNQNDFEIKVFCGHENRKAFWRKVYYPDTCLSAIYQFDAFPENGDILMPVFSECIGDSVYTKMYGATTLFPKTYVFSRYDDRLNK